MKKEGRHLEGWRKVLKRVSGESKLLYAVAPEIDEARILMNGMLASRLEDGMIEDLVIRDKQARYVPLSLNVGQKMLLEAMWRQKKAEQPVRIVLLKARQFGGSTLAQACLFLDSYYRPRRESWVVAHNLASARALAAISRRFHQNMESWEHCEAAADNRHELAFTNGSRINVVTANDVRAGRGFTVHNLHASEVAYWWDAGSTMLSLLQSVPDHPDTCVIVESTARGLGGWFHDLWRAAKAGANTFIPVFVGWNMVEEYSLAFVSEEDKSEFESSLTDEESGMISGFALSLEQIKWRRACIADKCGGREDVFRQEYPLHDQEAFLTSGRPVFDAPALDGMYVSVQGPVVRAEVAEEQLRPASSGRLKIWLQPEPGAAYVIGADVSEGIEVGKGAERRDNSCVQVLRRDNLEQAACWTGKTDPDALADVVLCMAQYYNSAFVGIEANNHGLTTLTYLKNRYNRIYRREIFDEKSRRRTEKLGWLTTMKTRPLMIDELARAIREKSVVLNDADTLSECMSFVYDKNGRMSAQEGCFDDRVFALAVALQMHRLAPAMTAEPNQPGEMEQRLDTLIKLRSGQKGASRGGWNVV